jgi:hypothetical protein
MSLVFGSKKGKPGIVFTPKTGKVMKLIHLEGRLSLFQLFDQISTIFSRVTFCLETKSNQKRQEILILPCAVPPPARKNFLLPTGVPIKDFSEV